MLNTIKNKVVEGFRSLSERNFSPCETIKMDLIKPEADTKEYRLIQLKNGLRALLISDIVRTTNDTNSSTNFVDTKPSTWGTGPYVSKEYDHQLKMEGERSNITSDLDGKELAACTLCVGVGSFSDPPDIQGLAHILEHAVFLGSQKYPGDSKFDSFIKRHGGSCNAETGCERTVFYFDCSENSLKEAMDRFAQFLISPSLTVESVANELENVESEFHDYLLCNFSRKSQVFYSLAPNGHPARKFSWGNMKSLRHDVDSNTLFEALHEFRRRHYSAHRMTLAVQAKIPLDTLEKYVCDIFSAIPNNNLPPDDFTLYHDTFGSSGEINKILWIKPITKMNQLQLSWLLPSYVNEYKSRPVDYLAWFINHEGEGSLSAFLSKRIWTLRCSGGDEGFCFRHNSMYSVFSVFLKLTEDGFMHLKEVIAAVFSYLAMLRENGPNEAIFSDLEFVHRTDFRFRRDIYPSEYVEILAESMQLYEPNHIIAGGNLYFEYKPELYKDMINRLTPDKVNILISNSDQDDVFFDKIEPWFGTAYRVEEIPEDWMETWMNCKATEDFHLPEPNPYISTNFDILEIPENQPKVPVIIIDDGIFEIWHCQDSKFKLPFGYYNFLFSSSVPQNRCFNLVQLDILLSYLRKKLTEKCYCAHEADLYYDLFRCKFGVALSFSGFSEKLPMLFEDVLKTISKSLNEMKSEENKVLLEAVIKDMSLTYYNKLLNPENYVEMIHYSVLIDGGYTLLDFLKELPNVTVEKLFDFGIEFFTKTCVLGLIQGNVTKFGAIDLCTKFTWFFNFIPTPKLNPNIPVLRLNQGETYLKIKSLNPIAKNSVIMNYYQFGPKSLRDSCIINLILLIMDDPLFNELRTKQRIGYNVICGVRDTYGILAFAILICFQPDKFDAEIVDSRIETFLNDFLETLKSISQEELNEMKIGMCYLKRSVGLDLDSEVLANFDEILCRQYMFDRYVREAKITQELSLQDLCSWYENNFLLSKNYKKLSIQVVGSPDQSTSIQTGYNLEPTLLPGLGIKKDKFVLDFKQYQNRREFYPIIPCS